MAGGLNRTGISAGATYRDLEKLTRQLERQYQNGEPFHLPINGRPELHILSFVPLHYEVCEIMPGRTPRLKEEGLLRAIFRAPYPDDFGEYIYAGVVAKESYGFDIAKFGNDTKHALNGVAVALGHSPFIID